MNAPRFILYSHDGLGLGHVRRNLAIAAALLELAPEAAVLLATGSDEVGRLGRPSNVEVLKLPGLRKVENERYAARRLPISGDEIRSLRSELLAAAVQSFRPSVLLVDKHPLGAGGELKAALEALRQTGGRAALGLRDILDDRATILSEWLRHGLWACIAEHYERILVYGQTEILDAVEVYDFGPSLAQRTHYCGYVLNSWNTGGRRTDDPPPFATQPRSRPVVLATSGGGEDGFELLRTFIGAATGARWQGVVVTGPMASEGAVQVLRHMAEEAELPCYTFVPGLACWFGAVDALVCMGGYNTLAEAVSKRVPIVCVPRTHPRSEQLIRARAFESLGLLRSLEPEQLDPLTLRREVDLALSRPSTDVARSQLDFGGAARAAGHLLELTACAGREATGRRLAV